MDNETSFTLIEMRPLDQQVHVDRIMLRPCPLQVISDSQYKTTIRDSSSLRCLPLHSIHLSEEVVDNLQNSCLMI